MSLIKRTIKRAGMLAVDETASIIGNTEPGPNELHVTIWNDKGEIVYDAMDKCNTATAAEIDEMVGLIDSGIPAHLSAYLVTHGPKQ